MLSILSMDLNGCTNKHTSIEEDPQEDSIRIQQRLEANISKTLTLHAPVKPMRPKTIHRCIPIDRV
jgi:hypothetical protein